MSSGVLQQLFLISLGLVVVMLGSVFFISYRFHKEVVNNGCVFGAKSLFNVVIDSWRWWRSSFVAKVVVGQRSFSRICSV